MKNNEIKEPVVITLTTQQVAEVCACIDLHWEYLLLTRLVFNSRFPKDNKYATFPFYKSMGKIEIQLPEQKTEAFIRASKGIGYWHNQNYLIRLAGIINEYKIIAHGKSHNVTVVVLLDLLRNKIGAHQFGNSKSNNFHKLIGLINDVCGTAFVADDLNIHPLAIDATVEKIKDQVKAFVKSLETPTI